MNKWKWGAILAVIIAAWWGGCKYGVHSVTKNTIVDTATTRNVTHMFWVPFPVISKTGDTVYAKSPKSSANQRHNVPDTVYLDAEPNTVYLPADIPDWAIDRLNECDMSRTYDTTFIRGGDTVRIQTDVYRNEVKRQSIDMVSYDTNTTKTVLIKPPRNVVGYFTLSGGANIDGKASAAIGFQLKLPNDRTYAASYQKIFGIKQSFVMVTVGMPLRLFPNKK